MPERGDEVAGRIEARIREALEKIVADMRSSIDDVRKAVDQQLEAAARSVQADFKAFGVRPHLEEGLRELEEEREPEIPTPGAGPEELKRALRSIEAGKNQIDVLNSLLEQCLRYSSRAALLIIRDTNLSGWRGSGFGEGEDPFKKFTAGRGEIPQLDQLVREETLVTWDGTNLAGRAGFAPNRIAAAIPMVIKDKVAAALYVDVSENDRHRFDLDALQILVFTTGLLIDTLPIRKNVPSPTLQGDLAASSPSSTPAPPDSGDSPSEQTVAIPSLQFGFQQEPHEEPPAARPPGFRTVAAPIDRVDPSAPAPGDADEKESAGGSASPTASESDRPSTQYIPPPGLSRRSTFGYSGEDETRKHDEAKRFARLLVSEIKLYNESQVEQGRREKDIYDRLKEDIDRSRQIYDERVPDDVRKSSNYYYDELIRILAGGDPEALGL